MGVLAIMKKFLSNIIRVICIAILGLFVLQVLFTIILNLVSENEHEKGLTGANPIKWMEEYARSMQ